MVKIGDVVRFLNDVGGGTVVRLDGRTAYVRDPEDGFETPMPINELIVVPGAGEAYTDPNPETEAVADAPLPARKTPPSSEPTFALLFEPKEIRRLSQSAFNLYLVNDSIYKIYFAVSSRDEQTSVWTLVQAGEAEPGVKVFLDEPEQEDLNSLRHLSVQIIAFRSDDEFKLLQPVNFCTRVDLTRLAKLHCFTPTTYSATPVLTIPVITKGVGPEQVNIVPLSAMRRPMPTKKTPQPAKKSGPEVVDLHIHELLDSTAGLQPADMLACQLREFDRRMEAAAKHPGSKIIFIHGKGEGVLRAAIIDRLRKRWPRCEVQDASFREYGFGATQVTIHR